MTKLLSLSTGAWLNDDLVALDLLESGDRETLRLQRSHEEAARSPPNSSGSRLQAIVDTYSGMLAPFS